MIAFLLVLLVAGAGYLGYIIGADIEAGRDRPCPHCHIRQQTVAAEMQLQRLTHTATRHMLDTARRAQFEQRDELS